jgi:hypothetical protein
MEDHEAKTAAMLQAVQSEPGEPCVLDCYFCRRCGKIVADESQFADHLHGEEDRSPQPPRALVPFAITVLSSADNAKPKPQAPPKKKPGRIPRYTAGPQASDKDLAITVGLDSYDACEPAPRGDRPASRKRG